MGSSAEFLAVHVLPCMLLKFVFATEPRRYMQRCNFPFSFAGFPVPEVSWFRDGQVISAATLPGVQISFSEGRAKLMIPAVSAANSGRYSVRAANGAGQITSTAELLTTGMAVFQKNSG